MREHKNDKGGDAGSDRLLTDAELASRWAVSKGALRNARSERRGIPFVRLTAGCVRYRFADVLAAETAALVVPVVSGRRGATA